MPNHIGSLNEKQLHEALKVWYAQPDDQFEVPVDGFIIDIVRNGLLIEIQTRNFSAIKHKLIKLTEHHCVRLAYPIAQEKWIVKPANDEQIKTSRRKSPKRGTVYKVFRELVRFPQLIVNPNFSLHVSLFKRRRYVVITVGWADDVKDG